MKPPAEKNGGLTGRGFANPSVRAVSVAGLAVAPAVLGGARLGVPVVLVPGTIGTADPVAPVPLVVARSVAPVVVSVGDSRGSVALRASRSVGRDCTGPRSFRRTGSAPAAVTVLPLVGIAVRNDVVAPAGIAVRPAAYAPAPVARVPVPVGRVADRVVVLLLVAGRSVAAVVAVFAVPAGSLVLPDSAIAPARAVVGRRSVASAIRLRHRDATGRGDGVSSFNPHRGIAIGFLNRAGSGGHA
jgi:hypothetical protein